MIKAIVFKRFCQHLFHKHLQYIVKYIYKVINDKKCRARLKRCMIYLNGGDDKNTGDRKIYLIYHNPIHFT